MDGDLKLGDEKVSPRDMATNWQGVGAYGPSDDDSEDTSSFASTGDDLQLETESSGLHSDEDVFEVPSSSSSKSRSQKYPFRLKRNEAG